MTYLSVALISFIFVLTTDIVIRINSFIGISNGSTVVVAIINALTSLCLLKLSSRYNWKHLMPQKSLFCFKLFMAWNLISLIRGAYEATDYWDWKMLLLNYSFSILIPLAIVVGLNYEFSQIVFKFILNKLIILGFLFMPIILTTDFGLYPRAMASVSLLTLFLPYLKSRWRVLVLTTSIVSIFMDVSYRSNMLRIIVPFFLLFMYIFRGYISRRSLNLLAFLFFCLPLIFLLLGVYGKFNVFSDNPFDYEVNSMKDREAKKVNLAVDTRTFLYEEVFSSMKKRNSSFLVGEGGGAGYESDSFADTIQNERGRYGAEVGFLNTFLYSGAIGVLFYALMLFLPAYYSINQSNNFLCKLLGIFLTFRWVLFFIEDITKMDLNFYFLWITIGLCLSNRFRALTDIEIAYFFGSSAELVGRRGISYRDPA